MAIFLSKQSEGIELSFMSGQDSIAVISMICILCSMFRNVEKKFLKEAHFCITVAMYIIYWIRRETNAGTHKHTHSRIMSLKMRTSVTIVKNA